MKILIVNPSFWIYGGAERVIVKLANYLTDHNHQCTILTTKMLPEIRKDLNETRLIFCNDLNEMASWLNKIHQDFDVINYHNDPVQLLHFGKKTKAVWMCNEPPQVCLDGGELQKAQKDAVKFIGKIVVADKFNQTRFKKIYGMDSEIINYGVDYAFWQKGNGAKFRKKYDLEDAFVITQVGFIHPMKNQAETLKVFKEVKKTIPSAKLVLAGYETPHKMQLEDYIFENNLQADITFTGFVSQEEIRDIYDGSDVAFFPIKTQGGWLSIFDAISTGMHVVISEEATCSSIVKEHDLGKVGGDYVKNIIKCQEIGPQMGLQKDWVKENLSWDKFCEKMLEVFNGNDN